MNILRYISFSKIVLDFSFTNFFCCFQLWKIGPLGQGEVRQGSRRSVSGVNEKCAWGQGKVRQGSRRRASAEYHTFSESTSPWRLMHFSLTPVALLLHPRRTYPWPLTHFSLTTDELLLDLEGLFFRVENNKKMVKEKFKIVFENVLYLIIFIRFSG